MFDKIINFFKKLFGTSNVSEASELTPSIKTTEVETVNECSQIVTKLLVNNNIKGYDIKHLYISGGNGIISNVEIPNGESHVLKLITNEEPDMLTLLCDVVAVENGETFPQLTTTCSITPNAQFQTVNITDNLLNLKKICFDATVKNEVQVEVK